MNGYTCPIDGCDYGTAEGDNKTLAALRSHSNAKSDGRHDWPSIRAAVTTQTPDESDESETDDDEQPEPEEEQTEADENDENDQPDMDQSDEYDQQIKQGESSETSDESDGDGQNDQPDDQPGGRGSWSPSAGTILAGTAVLGLAVLLSGGSDDEQEPIEVESEMSDPTGETKEAEPAWE
jgi:hypothetical protein